MTSKPDELEQGQTTAESTSGPDDKSSTPSAFTIVLCELIPPHHWVPQALCEEVYQRASARLEMLSAERSYKTQDVLGRDYWLTKSNEDRRAIGRIVAHLVCTGRLELEFASCAFCTVKRYRPK